MPIAAGDVLRKLSVAAAAGNTTAQPDPNASLGDQVSTTQLTNATLNNLFDDVTGDENAASDVEYRCLFIHNNHATLAYQNVVVYLQSETAGGASVAIGVDTTAASAVGSGAQQALIVANENTAPAGVTFSSPTTKAGGISVGTLAAGQVRAIWVRRTAANSAALDLDGVVLAIEGDTAA